MWRGTTAGVVGFGALLGLGCGGDDPNDWTPGRPRIDAVRFVGQDPTSALGLQFALTFVDDDGDLGGGTLSLEVGDRSAGSLPLPELFGAQRPPLDAAATEGEIEVLVRLDDTPQTGDRVEFGFMLQDVARRRSNRPTVTLEATSVETEGLLFTDPPGGGE